MSLLTDIQNNTSSVINGKLNLAQAIENKGGILSDYMLVPSFSNLVDGVNNIETGLKVNGTTNATFLAADNIFKGDVCSLKVPNISGYVANSITDLPNTYTGTDPLIMGDGEFVLFAKYTGTSSGYDEYSWYPYALVDGIYQPLKVNGVITYTETSSTSTYISEPSRCYDKENKYYYVPYYSGGMCVKAYKLDLENLNLVLEKDYKSTQLSADSRFLGTGIFAYNKHIFVNVKTNTNNSNTAYSVRLYYLDDDSNDIVYIGMVNACTDLSSTSYRYWITNIMVDGDKNMLVAFQAYYSGTSYLYLVKYSIDASTGMYAQTPHYAKFTDAVTTTYLYKRWITTGSRFCGISFSGTLFIYLNKNNTLIAKWLTPTLIPSDAVMEFSDGLDTTKISSMLYTGYDGYLYVTSTDTDNYTTAELVRLYKLIPSADALVFEFVGCPSNFFTPAASENSMPISSQVQRADRTVILRGDTGWYTLYDVGKPAVNYDYVATPTSNKVEDTADGYGIATQGITTNEIGTGVVIVI